MIGNAWAAASVADSLDWHTVALAMAGILVLVVGWVWVSTIGRLENIARQLTEHTQQDSDNFKEMLATINGNKTDIIDRINGRWKDDDRATIDVTLEQLSPPKRKR